MTGSILTKKTRLTLRYDGKATNEHMIDAVKLAGAINGMAKAVKQADKLLNGESSEIEVNVVAFQDGCFGALFEFDQLSNATVDVLKALGFIVGVTTAMGVTGGVMKWIGEIGDRKVKAKKVVGDKVNLTLSDETELLVDKSSAELVTDPIIREGISDIFYQPLVSQEAESVSIGVPLEDGNAEVMSVLFSISEEQSLKYKKPATLTKSEKEITEVTKDIKFTKIDFKKITGWAITLPNGEEFKNVTIKDTAFFDRVKANSEKFSSEQTFSTLLEKTTTTKLGVSTVSYNVKQVLRHRTSPDKKIF